MTTATKLLQAIDEAMQKDQGAAFRQLQEILLPKADDAYQGVQPPFRNHLGASMVGRECAREIWYGFRWTTQKNFDGRMLRLFNRGHLEEPRMVALLMMVGCQVWQYDERGKQFRLSKGHKGHGGGAIDGVVKGVPDMPEVAMLTEFKTHGDKSFVKLKEDGLLKAKWEHYVQMQTCMGELNLSHGLYMAVNKNTDELHAEIVKYDATQHQRSQQRTILIIDSKTPPPRIGKDETFFKCKFCDHRPVCHLKAPATVTCRTCKHISVEPDSKWVCTLHQEFRTSEEQLHACPQYAIIPEVHSNP